MKVIAVLFFIDDFFVWEDHYVARNLLLHGEMFCSFEGVRSYAGQFPVYPFVVFVFYSVFGSDPVYPVLYNIALQGISAVLLYHTARRFLPFLAVPGFDEKVHNRISFLTAAAFAIYPPLGWYAMFNVHPFSQNLFFLLLQLFLAVKYITSSQRKYFWFLCIAAGFSVLDRNTMIVGILPLVLWLYRSRSLKTFLIDSVALLLVVFAIGLPWLIRNSVLEGRFAYTSKLGRSFYIGAIPDAMGDTYLSSGKDYTSMLTPQETDSFSGMNAAQQDDFYMNKFVSLVKSDPLEYVSLYVVKLKNFWLFRSQIGNTYPGWVQPFIPVYVLFGLVMLILALAGLYLAGSRGWYLFLVPVGLSLLQSIFYVETRHRVMVEPVFIFFAFISLAVFYYRKKSGESF